ncbi:hypothetical protein AB6A40_008575 [Gnathostoma spinigerum]|uniref:Uncharacterized protein n=1 Tax=Gnathostoma spinigerum TaxID=75299 RepID=A0ABD6EWK0_9BILA
MVLCTVSPKSLSGKAFTEKDIKRRIITRFCDRIYQNITYKIEPIDVSRLYEFAFTMHRAVVTGIVAALMIVSTILVICSIEKKTLSGPRNDADIRSVDSSMLQRNI